MKLRDIINQIDYLCEVKILQTDAYLETSEHYGEEEEIYFGNALDIPWWIANMYLDGEGCIGVADNTMIIYVKETGSVKNENKDEIFNALDKNISPSMRTIEEGFCFKEE